MVTVYHNVGPDASTLPVVPAAVTDYRPRLEDLELAAAVSGTDDPAEAFDHVIHRDGENWTADPAVTVFGSPRGRRSSQEGDVFVTGDGTAFLVVPIGFRVLTGLRLPFLPGSGA